MDRPAILGHKVTTFGKQVKVNDQHWADAAREEHARVIAKALENYFRKGA